MRMYLPWLFFLAFLLLCGVYYHDLPIHCAVLAVEKIEKSAYRLGVKPEPRLEPDKNKDDGNSDSRIFGRSPGRAAQNGIDIVESGSKYPWGGAGTEVLYGVGKLLKAGHDAANSKAAKAAAEWRALRSAGTHKSTVMQHFPGLYPAQQKVLLNEALRREFWARFHLCLEMQEEEKVVTKARGAIWNIGQVNRDMYNRMMKGFRPNLCKGSADATTVIFNRQARQKIQKEMRTERIPDDAYDPWKSSGTVLNENPPRRVREMRDERPPTTNIQQPPAQARKKKRAGKPVLASKKAGASRERVAKRNP